MVDTGAKKWYMIANSQERTMKSKSYIKSIELIIKHHQLALAGQGESDEARTNRSHQETLWNSFEDPEENELITKLEDALDELNDDWGHVPGVADAIAAEDWEKVSTLLCAAVDPDPS